MQISWLQEPKFFNIYSVRGRFRIFSRGGGGAFLDPFGKFFTKNMRFFGWHSPSKFGYIATPSVMQFTCTSMLVWI